VIPRGVTRKDEVSVGIGISPLAIRVSSPETGFISSMSEEDIRTETPNGKVFFGRLPNRVPMNIVKLVFQSARVKQLDLIIAGRESLTTNISEVSEDGEPWSLGTGDGIGDSARMI